MPLDVPPFRPHPLVRGGHLQTIIGTYLPVWATCESVLHRVPLADGDAIAVHEDLRGTGISACRAEYGRQECLPHVAILVHGLGGSNQSTYMLRCSDKLRTLGVRVFRMDLRSCGAGAAWARHPLHAGRSEDAAAVLNYVRQRCPEAAIHLIGFSMGGNIVLKLVGELGEQARGQLASVVAAAPPIDLVECTRNIQRGWNQLYDRRFTGSLVRHVRRRAIDLPDAPVRPLVPLPRRLMDFDRLFTAPLAGFADVDDYYQRASSCRILDQIAVPTLIVAAASDPIVPAHSFENARYSSTTQLIMAPCGGHLGFVAAAGIDADRRWLDWRVVDWVRSQQVTRRRLPVAHDTDEWAVKDAVAAGIDDRRSVDQ